VHERAGFRTDARFLDGKITKQEDKKGLMRRMLPPWRLSRSAVTVSDGTLHGMTSCCNVLRRGSALDLAAD
jgi:hypothetical protein